MRAREIMTNNPECCEPDDTAREAAELMRDHDCGCVPIVDSDSSKVIGIVTDRDLAVRAIAEGKDTETRLRDLMTPVATCCGPDDDVRDVERTMADLQVRRIPIVDAAGRCVGIISQADIARACRDNDITEQEIALVVEQISEPTRKGGTRPGMKRSTDSGMSAQF